MSLLRASRTRATNGASAFNAVLSEYLKAPDVTRTRIYLETMGEVLPQIRDRIIVDEKVIQLLPLLPGAGRSGEVRLELSWSGGHCSRRSSMAFAQRS